MQLTRYINTSDPRTLNKAITEQGTINVSLKDDTDIMYPVIELSPEQLPPNINYCYIPTFGRYYYINQQQIERGKLLTIRLSVDVLMSFRDIIKNSTVIAARSSNKYNRYIGDNIPTLNKQNNVYKRFIPFQGALAFDSESITMETPCILLTIMSGGTTS